MIVPMRKATVIARRGGRQETLRRLRRLGLLHLAEVPSQVPSAQEWREKRSLLERALAAIAPAGKRRTPPPSAGADIEAALQSARAILEKQEMLRALDEELAALDREAEILRDWQGISLADLQALRGQGRQIRLYEVPARGRPRVPAGHQAFIVRRRGGFLWLALVGPTGEAPELDGRALEPPRRGPLELERLRGEKRAAGEELRRELRRLEPQATGLERAIAEAGREIELAEAAAAMGQTEALSYLTGFLPADQAGTLAEFCRGNGWGLLLREPGPGDEVPTIVRNRRWIDLIRPVFGLLGTVPGYREFDISLFFLVFFAFFFAVIIGDAGYGLVLLAGTLLFRSRLRRRGRDIPREVPLMLLLRSCTVVWGALTGTWFGSAALAAQHWLSWMAVPAISSFEPRSSETIKLICFITGTVHIAAAHLWSFARQARQKPFLRALAQLGWLSLVLGLFHLVLNLVLSGERFPVPAYAYGLMAVGLAAIIVFSRQEGRFLRGVAQGLANLLTTFLNGISAFSDIISYIRLFAVGLATVEIAKSFNAMAAGMADGALGAALAVLVLLLGHALNLAMGALSVVVHGVRLNMLEFSGHLGMEWTGRPYKPFKE